MKKFLLAMVLMPLMALADTETVDGVTWTYTIRDGKAQIGTGSSYSPAIPSSTSGAITIPPRLGDCPVTSIGDYAFYYCSKLTVVTMPEGVTSIGNWAFYNCSKLTSITIPSSVTSIGENAFIDTQFYNSQPDGVVVLGGGVLYRYKGTCPSSVMIPEGVASIGSSAFHGCSGLTSVTISSSVTSIGDNAFSGCSGLESVTILKGVTYIGSGAFCGCSGLASVVIPEGVTYIGSSAFSGCSGLMSLEIPEGVMYIGGSAFYGCRGLTSVVIPEGVTDIGSSAFYGCGGLTSVTMPSSVTSVGDSAFWGCDELTEVRISDLSAWCGIAFSGSTSNPIYFGGTLVLNGAQVTNLVIPEGVKEIRTCAFYGCGGLTSVTIPSSVTRIGDFAFGRCSDLTSVMMAEGVWSIGWSAFGACSGLTSLTIPSSVTRIEGAAFSGCSGLKSVVIPEGVKAIENYAFDGCSGLASVTIPSSVTSVGDFAFSGCCGLTSLVLPSGVTSIGRYAFYDCSRLTSMTMPEGMMSIGDYAFSACDCLLMVSMPSSVTSIGNSAFAGCSRIKSVTMPPCVENLSATFPDAYKAITNVVIMAGSTSIGIGEFAGCSKLKSVTIPEGVTRIGECAFLGCRNLESVMIPSTVTSVGYRAFEDCNGIKSVMIPPCISYLSYTFPDAYNTLVSVVVADGVSSIEDKAFAGCGRLAAVTIPSSVTSIGRDAFEGCYSLQIVFVTDQPQDCVKECFGDRVWCQEIGTPISYEWEVSREDGAATIVGVRPAFGSVDIPAEIDGFPVTSIGDCAFYDCSGITSVTIPSSITNIGYEAFYRCSELSSATIPSSVTSIGEYAFDGCANLTLTFEGLCPENYIGSGVLEIKKVNFPDEYEWSYPTVQDALNELGYRLNSYVRRLDIYDVSNGGYFSQMSGSVWCEGDDLSWGGLPTWLKFGTNGVPLDNDSITFGYERTEFATVIDYNSSLCLCSDVLTSYIDEWLMNCSSDSCVLNEKSDGEPYKMGECVALQKRDGSDNYNYCQVSIGLDEYSTSWFDYGIFHKGTFYIKIPASYDTQFWDYYYNYNNDNLYKFRTWYLGVDCGTGIISYSLEIGPPCKSFSVVFDVSPYALNCDTLLQHNTGTMFDSCVGDWYSIDLDPNDSPEPCYQLEDREWWVEEYDDWGGTYGTCETVQTRHYEAGFDVDAGWRFVGWKLKNGNVKDTEGVLLSIGSVVESVQDFSAESDASFEAVYEPIMYGIVFEDVKGCENANTNAYTVEDEVVFLPLADLPDWHFDGWSPASIPVGSTGDVTVQALWRPIETAEIVGAWSEPQTFEYDGKAHGVDYSAQLDVMEWPLNVVTQGTIRAVNVGEYAATATAETVGVPETDAVYYRCAAVTNECRWTITPKPVTKLQITYVSTAMIANGQQQKPQIVVRDVERGVVLTSADYLLVYENNVEPGRGVARITGKGNYGGETTTEFPIVAGVSPVEGLNMDGCTFEIAGEADWVADNAVTHDGYASMRSGAIGSNETSALTAVVHGAGTVSFWWKVSSQHFDSVLELDRLEFYVDGVRQKWVNGDVDWTKLSFKVNGAGPHELKWVYAKDGSISEREDCGWVDEVSWEKEWLIGDWLNDVDREFATSNVKWSPDAAVSSDGVGSMRSGACQQGQRSVLSTVVENVGTLTFKWKCSCVAYGEYVTDKLSLLVDGVAVKDAEGKDIFINGETGWCDVSYRITGAGRHEVQWVFEKISDRSMGQNCGWVDVVRWDNEPGTLTDEDLVVDAFDGAYDGQGHGAAVSVKGVYGASVKYGTSREAIGDAEPPTFVNCGEHEVWFAVNVPDFNEYVGKMVVRIRPRSIETGEVTLGEPLVYTGSALTQTVSSVVVDGLAATFEVSDNAACAAGLYQLTVTGIGNFCGELSVPFAVAKAQALSDDVTVEGYSPDAGAVEFTYDGEAHQPTVVARYDGAAVVRFALTEAGPYADELNVSNAVERLDVWYEISSANYERLVGRTQMTIRPMPIAGAEVVLGEQVSDVEGHVVQLVDSVIVNGLPATFVVSNNVATAEGDFELCVYGTSNFTGTAKCPYSVGGIVLPPGLTPGDGTIFTESLVVRFSAQTPDSKWYYTLDGSMPTTNSLKAARVNLHGKTTIRAIAVLDGKLRSAVVEARYALGACENPKIRLDGQDGCVFHFPGQLVVIDRNGDEGVVRYTLDGSEPTAESPAYEGPFAISASTTVKAKTFSDSWFDSETATVDLRLEVLSVPPPVIQAASEYKGTRTTVSMSCALDGAVIRYTLDGSEPTATSALYEKPFEIGGAVGSEIQVRARAFREGYEGSSVAEVAVKRVWGIGDTLGVPDMMFTTDGWTVDPQETFGELVAMRSGPTGDGETNALATVVHGGGVVAFSWRTSCEDSFGDFIWDRAEFWVDDVCVAKVEGETSWNGVEYEIPDDGADHVLRWLYVKDPDLYTAEGEDCAWLAAVSWTKEDAAPTVIVTEDPNGEIVLPAGKDISEVAVSVMCNGYNIFPYLNLPAAVNGVIDLSQATVKDEIAKEPLDTTKGAKIELRADDPKITTAPTKPGLTYTLREGETLEGMVDGDSKVGDGEPWTPEIKVKGGNSAFYSIGVSKGK